MLFASDIRNTRPGNKVGFDGSCVETPAMITEHLEVIYADHGTGTHAAWVLEVRQLGENSMLARSVVDMVPPSGSDIDPDKNTVQALGAVQAARGWRIAHFQNTPGRSRPTGGGGRTHCPQLGLATHVPTFSA
jgi:uncharacterized protein (TIGR02246 family)